MFDSEEIVEAVRRYLGEPSRTFRWMPVEFNLASIEVVALVETGEFDRAIARCRLGSQQGCLNAVFSIVRHEGGSLGAEEIFEMREVPLIDALLRSTTFRGPLASQVADALERSDGDSFAVPLQLDQTNSAFLLGETGFGKFYRRCGENTREARLYAMLGDSPAVSRYWGSFYGDDSAVVATVVDRVRDASSAWDIAMGIVREQSSDASAKLRELIYDCGVLLGRLHDDLSQAQGDGAIVSKQAFANWIKARLELEDLDAGVVHIRHASALQEYAIELSRCVAQLWGRWPSFEIHGDFHLGQIVKGSRGLVAIDFEGEPLADAGAMDLPERDLAGLLRSIGYLVAVGSRGSKLSRSLAAELRGAALAGYSRSRVGERWMAEPSSVALLGCLEVEKAIYEYLYESRFRPEMLSIPAEFLARVSEHLTELPSRCVAVGDGTGERSLRALIVAEYAL